MHAQLIHQTMRLKFRVDMTAETLAWLHCGGSDVVARKKNVKKLVAVGVEPTSARFFIRHEEDDLTTDLFLVHGSRFSLNDFKHDTELWSRKSRFKTAF